MRRTRHWLAATSSGIRKPHRFGYSPEVRVTGANGESRLAHKVCQDGDCVPVPASIEDEFFDAEQAGIFGHASGDQRLRFVHSAKLRQTACRHDVAVLVPLIFWLPRLISQNVLISAHHEQGQPEALDGPGRIVWVELHGSVDGLGPGLRPAEGRAAQRTTPAWMSKLVGLSRSASSNSISACLNSPRRLRAKPSA